MFKYTYVFKFVSLFNILKIGDNCNDYRIIRLFLNDISLVSSPGCVVTINNITLLFCVYLIIFFFEECSSASMIENISIRIGEFNCDSFQCRIFLIMIMISIFAFTVAVWQEMIIIVSK